MAAEKLANMEFDPRTVKPVESRYANNAIPGKVNILFCDQKRLIFGLPCLFCGIVTQRK
jgi:hypothetical protein